MKIPTEPSKFMCGMITRRPLRNYSEITRVPFWYPCLRRMIHPPYIHTQFLWGSTEFFQLAMFSKLPLAVKFKRWVFEEVLPSIRGTGTYTLPSALKSIENVKAALLILLSEITKLQEIVMYRNPRLISVGNNTFILLDYKYERTLWV